MRILSKTQLKRPDLLLTWIYGNVPFGLCNAPFKGWLTLSSPDWYIGYKRNLQGALTKSGSSIAEMLKPTKCFLVKLNVVYLVTENGISTDPVKTRIPSWFSKISESCQYQLQGTAITRFCQLLLSIYMQLCNDSQTTPPEK